VILCKIENLVIINLIIFIRNPDNEETITEYTRFLVKEKTMKLVGHIRRYALGLVTIARNSNHQEVTISAKEIHDALNLDARFPAVCGAIDSNIFSELAHVNLIQRNGPKQSSTVTWVFEIY
jgi:hypothetical protein